MELKTLFNHRFKYPGFVVKNVRERGDRKALEITMVPRKNSKPICSGCGQCAPHYDTRQQRAFEHIPIWGVCVFILYVMRRVQCEQCGVKIEKVPWADGKNTLTKSYMQFLAGWAKTLSWSEVGRKFNISWDKVFRSVEYVVTWGLKHRVMEGIEAIGVDEIAWKKGHKYLTLVYEISKERMRLLWISERRTTESFSSFFDLLGQQRCKLIKYVCSDMWKPYKKVIQERIPHALHILDRFHIVANINKAVDKVRAEEHRRLLKEGKPVLKRSRWLLLKRRENLKEQQEENLKELVKLNLKSVRAYLLKEDFTYFWSYVSPHWAGKFLDRWVTRVMRSKIDPMKKEARCIREHKPLILNWFRAKKQFSSGVVEGFNNKAKVTMRNSYGFKTYRAAEIALYHAMGDLPEPPCPHRFF